MTLINLQSHPFMRYLLKRRGVFSTLVERVPNSKIALDKDDRREISKLLEAIEDDLNGYPFGPE